MVLMPLRLVHIVVALVDVAEMMSERRIRLCRTFKEDRELGETGKVPSLSHSDSSCVTYHLVSQGFGLGSPQFGCCREVLLK